MGEDEARRRRRRTRIQESDWTEHLDVSCQLVLDSGQLDSSRKASPQSNAALVLVHGHAVRTSIPKLNCMCCATRSFFRASARVRGASGRVGYTSGSPAWSPQSRQTRLPTKLSPSSPSFDFNAHWPSTIPTFVNTLSIPNSRSKYAETRSRRRLRVGRRFRRE